MSIEFVEENNVSIGQGDFLPPVVATVRRSGRGVFNIVAVAFFVLASLALFVYDFVAGIFFIPVSLFLLVSWLVNFKKSKAIHSCYGLRFQRTAYLITAALLAVFPLLDEIEFTNRLLWELSSVLDGLTKLVPEQYRDMVNTVFSGSDTVAACLAVGCLCTALSFSSLNRSRCKNLPFTKTVFLSVVVNSVCGVLLVLAGLKTLNILAPTRCCIDAAKHYPEAILYFAFATVLFLFAVRLLLIYIKMRKVKNAVLKA